jgi:hypothetical protein
MKEDDMRVMVLVKATDESESGRMPSAAELNEMGQFNDRLVKAGIMLAGEGITPSSQGKRVRFGVEPESAGGPAPVVLDGPFAETKELVAGFWIWQVSSMEEALEWIKQAPFRNGEVELRRIFDADDFGDEFTPEMRAAEASLREQIGQ